MRLRNITLISAITLSLFSGAASAQACLGISFEGLSTATACDAGRSAGILPNAPTDLTFNYASGGGFPTAGALGLYRHPFNNPAAATSIGAIPAGTGSVDLLVGLDNRPDGSLVGLAGFNPTVPAARLVNVNTTTGALTTIAAVTGVNAGGVPIGLTINPRTGAAILGTFTPGAGGGTRLFTLDLTTGVATQIGTGVTSAGIALDLSTDCTGQVFAVLSAPAAGVTGPLARVNIATAAMTDIGGLGPIYGNFVAGSGFDFDNTTGQLFGGVSIGTTTITDSSYGSVNLTTGALTGATLGSATTRIASSSVCPSLGAPAITAVTPAGNISINSGAGSTNATTTLNFRNGTGTEVIPGTVSCALSATTGLLSITPTTAINIAPGSTGGFVVTGTGTPGSSFSGTVTCTVQGLAAPIVYTVSGLISPVTQITTLSNTSLALLGLLVLGFAGFAVRRFS